MSRTQHRRILSRRGVGPSARETRITLVCEALLVVAGCATGVWLIVSVLISARG